jgi:N-acetylmuramoyl-L-alanine amidase
LYDRTFLAELLDAELLISIHNNALPDGVNPFENHGTSVYYFHPHSLDLARALQRGLLGRLGLRDLGFGRSSLALVRPTWPLAVLTEGAFMMIPAQEAGLRQPDYLEAYARGVVDGIRDFLTARAE